MDEWGIQDCDEGWTLYGINCYELVHTHGIDCAGCECPGDYEEE